MYRVAQKFSKMGRGQGHVPALFLGVKYQAKCVIKVKAFHDFGDNLSPKTATAEKCDCRRKLRLSPRQCGQGFTEFIFVLVPVKQL